MGSKNVVCKEKLGQRVNKLRRDISTYLNTAFDRVAITIRYDSYLLVNCDLVAFLSNKHRFYCPYLLAFV